MNEQTSAGMSETILEEATRLLRDFRHEEAYEMLEQVLATSFRNKQLLNIYGSAALKLGHISSAIWAFRCAIALAPTDPYLLIGLANAHLKWNHDADEAPGLFLEAIKLCPQSNEPYVGLATCFVNSQSPITELRDLLDRSSLEINMSRLYFGAAIALLRKGRFEESLAVCMEASKIHPEDPHTLCLLGRVFDELGDPERASHYHDKGLKRGKQDPGIVEHYLKYLCETCRFAEACLLYKKCRKERLFSPFRNTNPQARPQWDGSQLHQKTVAFRGGAKGYGDIIQFIRFVPMLKEMGARTVLECSERLSSLMTSVRGVDDVVSSMDGVSSDFEEDLLPLMLLLGVDINGLCPRMPYLSPSALVQRDWVKKPMPPDRIKVGINWAGGDRYPSDAYSAVYRSIPLIRLAGLMSNDKLAIYSLQMGARSKELREFGERIAVTEIEQNNFDDTAGAIAVMDVIVTVDTSIAHLAGALGKSTLLMLPFSCDWRWMRNRNDTPFYPSMTLFRQPKPGDWGPVVESVTNHLATMAARRRTGLEGQESSRSTQSET